MNLTTTRAERPACAEPVLALKRLSMTKATCPARDRRTPAADAQRDSRPALTDRERLGRTLLGIDFETSVA